MASIRNLEAPKSVMVGEDGIPLPLWYQWFALVGNVLIAVTSSGATAQRPTKFLWVGRNFWNTDITQMEWYDGTTWVTWGGGGGGAPTNATYVTMSLDATLTNERVLTAGSNITITDGGANGPVTIAASGGAPSTATYVTMTTDAGLSNERTLAVGSPITLVDGGANNPVTLDFDEAAVLGNNARVAVSKNSGATVGTRRRLNLIEGTNVTLTIADDAGNEEVDVTVNATNPTRAVGVTFDGGGSALSVNSKADIRVPYSATISSVTMLADQVGSAVVDIWKDTYANFPPTVADSITAAAKPTIAADDQSVDSTLTGWTTAITANDCLRFNVDSCSTITRLTLILAVA
jgi:hypothetical protein